MVIFSAEEKSRIPIHLAKEARRLCGCVQDIFLVLLWQSSSLMDVDDSSSQGNRSKTLVAKCVATFFLCHRAAAAASSSNYFLLLLLNMQKFS